MILFLFHIKTMLQSPSQSPKRQHYSPSPDVRSPTKTNYFGGTFKANGEQSPMTGKHNEAKMHTIQ